MNSPRMMMAPPFYNAIVDIAFAFTGHLFKNSRKKFNIYAQYLVVVFLPTFTPSIIALRGLRPRILLWEFGDTHPNMEYLLISLLTVELDQNMPNSPYRILMQSFMTTYVYGYLPPMLRAMKNREE